MELTKKYDDSIASVEKTREIADLQSVYELEQSNEKIKEFQFAEQVNTSKRNLLLAILGGIGIVVIFILLYLTLDHKQVIIGENNVGKTNFLRAIQLILDRTFQIMIGSYHIIIYSKA